MRPELGIMEFVSLHGPVSLSSYSSLVLHPPTPFVLLPALLSSAVGRPRSLAEEHGREGGGLRTGEGTTEGQEI